MKKRTFQKSVKIIGRICWIVVIAVTIIWLISQQITINKYEAEVARLEDEKLTLKERNNELSTGGYELSDEEFEREARKQGYIRPDEVIIKEAE